MVDCGCIADAVEASKPSVASINDYANEAQRLTTQEPSKIIDCVLD